MINMSYGRIVMMTGFDCVWSLEEVVVGRAFRRSLLCGREQEISVRRSFGRSLLGGCQREIVLEISIRRFLLRNCLGDLY